MQFLENLPFDLNLLPQPVYVVGGAVRDGLIGRVRAELDLDLVIPARAVAVARQLAITYQAGFVLLDAERQIARVVFAGMTVDIAQQDGASITADLHRRDFTLNAIAYDLQTHTIIDPFDGQQDLRQQTIRMVRKSNLIDDPLRLLRAYRQASQLNFEIAADTHLAIKELAPLLTEVAAERVLMELRYLLATPNSSHWLAAMVEDQLLSGWLKIPVAKSCRDRLIQLDRSIELISQHYPKLDRELDRSVREPIGMSRKSIGKLIAILAPDLKLAQDQLSRLTFSSAEIQVVTNLITYLPALLATEMSLTEQYFWFKAVGSDFPLLISWAIANGVELSKLRDLIDRYFDLADQVAHPSVLVSGNTLMQALQLPPSPLIGKLLTEVQLARIRGEIVSADEAIQFVSKLI